MYHRTPSKTDHGDSNTLMLSHRFKPQAEPQHAAGRSDVPIDSLPQLTPQPSAANTEASTAEAAVLVVSSSNRAATGPIPSSSSLNSPLYSTSASNGAELTGAASVVGSSSSGTPAFNDPVWRSNQVCACLGVPCV